MVNLFLIAFYISVFIVHLHHEHGEYSGDSCHHQLELQGPQDTLDA